MPCRCSKCVECPSCSHTLSTVASAATMDYTFLCEFCRWSSADIGLIAKKPAALLSASLRVCSIQQ